ncbi:TRM11 family SAM-dependent methyltransferase [Patescibacteria group bacterium]
MTNTFQYAFILGSHPELSLAELKAVLNIQAGSESDAQATLTHHQQAAFLTSAKPIDAGALMERLGGTVKIVELVGDFDEEKLVDWLYKQLNRSSKFHFGFSLYAVDDGVALKKHWKTIHQLGLNLKKALKADGVSARYVQSREVALSSVIVHKERLLKNGVEIVLFKGRDSLRFGKTLAVQPFQDFSRRDYGRPERDHRSGMLPPKVARMMVNIAQPAPDATILDPFCGSGTVLQEALLLGFRNVIGSDVSEKAIDDTSKNLKWLKLPDVPLHVVDVEQISSVVEPHSVDCVVAEGYLGPTDPKKMAAAKKELTKLYKNAFATLEKTLKPGGRIIIALPAWKTGSGAQAQITTLPLEPTFKKLNLSHIRKPLFYGRPDARVVRHLYFLQKAE